MRLLLDECVPRKLGLALSANHHVKTIPEMGWSGLRDGEMLDAADEKFDALITVDQNLEFQQNLQKKRISVLTLCSRNNRLESLKPFIPEIEAALSDLAPGTFLRLRL